ncbi:MAG: hypothetical protein IKJ19_07510 [Clostridia bacterium]|nr:hypothetical protein [Clostridia bacterium]
MKIFAFVLPCFVLFAFISAFIKKVNIYDAFISGVNDAIALLLSIFPYICAVLIMNELAIQSGLWNLLCKLLKPLFSLFKIPPELTKLILLKPLSGSGSLAILSDIYKNYGVDSYISRCASCIFSSSETVFYIGALYFSKCKNKKLTTAIITCLLSNFASCIFACFICRFL